MIVIDRIEGKIAILEIDGETVEFPASALPDDAHEGDVLRIERCDSVGTNLQRENEERLKRLRERDSEDMDIEL
jgi:hypothetical protein